MSTPVPETTLPGGEPQDSALLDKARSFWLELTGLLHDHLQLAALETQHVGRSLVVMVVNGVMVALLLVSAWLGLLGAAILWLIHMGLMTSVALLLAVAFNLVLAALLYQLIRHQIRHIGWPATLRSLQKPISMKGNENASS